MLGCYRVHGVTAADRADIGFSPDTVLRLDSTVLDVAAIPRGHEYRPFDEVNRHPFWPHQENWETLWWVERDTTVILEWRLPRRSPEPDKYIYMYEGGRATFQPHGDTLRGVTMMYHDVISSTDRDRRAIWLVRQRNCP